MIWLWKLIIPSIKGVAGLWNPICQGSAAPRKEKLDENKIIKKNPKILAEEKVEKYKGIKIKYLFVFLFHVWIEIVYGFLNLENRVF